VKHLLICSHLLPQEAILAYYVLWQNGGQTPEEIDLRCETFLRQSLQERVDFEVDDAIRKLNRDGLVRASRGKLHAVPIKEAVQVLDSKWKQIFSTTNTVCPYCPFLGDTSAHGSGH
jgi:hypothetical protein